MSHHETRSTPAASSLMELLLRSGEALQNRQALSTLIVTAVGAVLLIMASASTGQGVVIALGGLLALVLVHSGLSAAGIQLMDQALGGQPRPMAAALLDGLFAAGKLLCLALLAGLGLAVGLLVLAVALLLCKIPVLGSLLITVLLPAGVLTVAFVYAALYFSMAMVGPAVWSGSSIRHAVSTLYVLATQRLVQTALGVVLHTVLMTLISSMLVGFISFGVLTVGGMSAGILASNNLQGFGMHMLMRAMSGMGGDNGLLLGAGFGLGILGALVAASLLSMFILGLNRLFLHLTAELDVSSADAGLSEQIQRAKERARQLQEDARRRAAEARERAEQGRLNPGPTSPGAPAAAPQVVATSPAPAALSCRHCQAPVEAGDRFCENCGQSLV
ncbi:zinc ribbon domain-containing protein [Curvibacter sp. RS43]|uniref:zinc ribbon domain-containing protein n=1 Tax=Curvibacter microcysteis TaxID=3026419 RepID=UPI0023622829|nr:zinc ribbon domain-containing protein [Curvibacter sp. RS43]MDD0809475.1 zinc ribbon domain-containing protein [Curvibacter sp. RS43]